METQAHTTLPPQTLKELDQAADRPLGAAAAVILAAGIGAVVLGAFTTLAEAIESFKDFLRFSDDVGPLSGKTIFGAGAFLVSWAILHLVWRGRNPPLKTVLAASGVLLVLGLIGTFPTFFEAFA